MLILGIETSCDETAASVVEGKNIGTQNIVSARSNIISSQINIHKKYGGVVPEVAAREHVLNILPVIDKALKKANLTPPPPLLIRRGRENRNNHPSCLGWAGGGIDAIAVSTGPGLITSLIVGIETAKALSYVWGIPVIPINHIEGHIYSSLISRKFNANNRELKNLFPAIVLTVSGGHTMLVLMKGHGKYKTIGETRDDAAGEAFDKAAKLLGLGYPGGPIIAEYAEKFLKQNFKNYKSKITNNKQITNYKLQITKNKSKIILPRPMINSNNYDFSFSGLKTALLYELKKDKNWKKKIPEYCHEFQQSVIDVLIHKTIKAAQEYKVKTIMLTGGVSANKKLRSQFKRVVKNNVPCSMFHVPCLQYTTDNAAMIATAGYFKALRKDFTPWQKLKVDPNQRLK